MKYRNPKTIAEAVAFAVANKIGGKIVRPPPRLLVGTPGKTEPLKFTDNSFFTKGGYVTKAILP